MRLFPGGRSFAITVRRAIAARTDGADVINVVNRPELGRYQLCLNGELAGYSAYEIHGAHVAFMHTQIEDGFAGHGLGDELVAHALDEVRAQGGSVLPYCPFVRSFVARHPKYQDLVPPSKRAAFELAGEPMPEGGVGT
ncbi:MAG TPA: GNAT family N-acetyltransferase [Solirubrobacteraceae bacterium]|nr:GNAT family N-acetyltransferase [Solirubrobacteraceae bacterium]